MCVYGRMKMMWIWGEGRARISHYEALNLYATKVIPWKLDQLLKEVKMEPQ